MAEGINIIVAAPPEFSAAAKRPGCAVGHMSYKIGRGFRLYRSRHAPVTDGGFMVLDTTEFIGGGPLAALVADVTDECRRRGFRGVVVDTESGSLSQLALSKTLAKMAAQRGLLYFVPESLAKSGENAIVKVSTALSGGTLKRHISDAQKKYGVRRVALEIERVCMDFTLPAHGGVGKELTKETLSELIDRHKSAPLFSSDLIVNYFTYRDNKDVHFVLFDNAKSIEKKLRYASRAEIEHAFLRYTSITDIYDNIAMGLGRLV